MKEIKNISFRTLSQHQSYVLRAECYKTFLTEAVLKNNRCYFYKFDGMFCQSNETRFKSLGINLQQETRGL